jgi:anti-anti-sigma regulatory factor
MEVEVLDTAQGVVVRIRGEAGVAEAGALTAALLPLVARRPPCVTFDLGELQLISSLATGVLVTYRRAAVRAGTRVCLAPEVCPAVREALDRAELTGLFETTQRAVPCAEDSQPPTVPDVQPTYGVTWAELVELEPQVKELLWRARLAGAGCRTSSDVERAFGPVRNELAGLIGFAGRHQHHPVLGSVGAYAVACGKLYDAVAGLLPARAGSSAPAPDNQGGGTGPEPCRLGPVAPGGDDGFIGGLGI